MKKNRRRKQNHKNVPASFEGKWYPPGWHVFFLFVCKHTRISENYRHLFEYDGKGLDSSNASNRKQARQKKQDQSEKRRKTELAAGLSRGMNIDEVHQNIHLNMKMSREKRGDINEDIAQRLATIANLQNQQQSLYQLLGQIKPPSEEFMTHPLYVETQRLSEKIKAENKVIEERRRELETFKNTDVYRKKAEEDLLKLHSLDSPLPVGKVNITAQTPVSILSDTHDSTFVEGKKVVAYESDDMDRPGDEGRSLHDDCNNIFGMMKCGRNPSQLPRRQEIISAMQSCINHDLRYVICCLKVTEREALFPGLVDLPLNAAALCWSAAQDICTDEWDSNRN
ncbi:predicted protein [Chaetoceros tenuissimus]|uniref:Uncharacterized protein n=1 Tax=Chaetoceros tenuissimus TaxID=426638 RepID=A0AAD3D7U4_9STRA|nr:predicted protein [Chaetoceros tenuissimus]